MQPRIMTTAVVVRFDSNCRHILYVASHILHNAVHYPVRCIDNRTVDYNISAPICESRKSQLSVSGA